MFIVRLHLDQKDQVLVLIGAAAVQQEISLKMTKVMGAFWMTNRLN